MKLANFSLDKKIRSSKVNFMAHTKYLLGVFLALLISAIFVVSFIGFKLDFDYAGGTILTTVVTSGLEDDAKFNENKDKIIEILNNNKVEVSSIAKEKTSLGDAIVIKILNKDTNVNNNIVNQINAEFNYDATDILEKNYVASNVVQATAINQTEMAAIALSVAIVLVAIYAIFRFNLLSSLVYLISVIGEILLVISATIICRIPINASFATSIILIFAVSTLLKILFFRQLKNNSKNENLKSLNKHEKVLLADKEIFSTLMLISILSLIFVVALTGLGTLQVRSFAIPVLIGIIITALTTFYVTPYLYEKINLKK